MFLTSETPPNFWRAPYPQLMESWDTVREAVDILVF